MLRREGELEAKPDPCDACREESFCEVWGHKLCAKCFTAWRGANELRDGLPKAGPGDVHDPGPHSVYTCTLCSSVHEAFCAEMTKRTIAWVAARRAGQTKGAA
jgi:hypothetical protein